MRIPSRGFGGGIYDPRLHSKDFPWNDSSNEGHFAAAAHSVVREASFATGTGTRAVELWRTPTGLDYIIEGATMRLNGNFSQSGTPQQIQLELQVERKKDSGYWLTLVQATLMETLFSGGAYSAVTNPSLFGMRGYQQDRPGVGVVESPLIAFDGAIQVTADSGTDVFTVRDGPWDHGIAIDEVVELQSPFGTLPTGITAGRYFKRGAGTSTFQLSTTAGGAAVNITTNGTPPFYVVPVEAGVTVGPRGIYIASNAQRFADCKLRLRATPVSGSNTYSGNVLCALQIRTVR